MFFGGMTQNAEYVRIENWVVIETEVYQRL